MLTSATEWELKLPLQLGGPVGRAMLSQLAKRFAPGYVDWTHADSQTTSGLRKFFGDDWLGKLAGKRVVDWGCGHGSDVVAAALAGAADAVGVDIQEDRLIAG